MKIKLFFILFSFIPFITLAQADGSKPKLSDFGLYEFPSAKDVDSTFLNPSDISVTPLSTENINSSFSKISDLKWVQKIATENKVIMLGETHYSTYVHNLCGRILFAINEADYYPLLIMEEEYSHTPYVNYFLAMADDQKATAYFNSTLTKFVDTKEDSALYQDIRRWNKLHTDKPIQVGFTDMEWDQATPMNEILKPYFKKLPGAQNSIDSIFNLSLSKAFFTSLEPLMKEAEKENLVGDYPFISPQYIQNVITNLHYTFYCFIYGMDYYRHKGMIRNITDENVFGRIFKNSKVLIYGGGNHATTHFNYPDGGNFLSEGSYLNYEYIPTKGKTYSIMIEGLAFELGDMCNVKPDKLAIGQQYKDICGRLIKAYNAGLIVSAKPYYAFRSENDFNNLIIHEGYQNNNSALLVNSINWDNLMKKASGRKDLLNTIAGKKDNFSQYDLHIFISYSPIEVMRAH